MTARSTDALRALVGAAGALLLAVAPATAAAPPPSLTADTAFAPPTGIAKYDFNAGTAADVTGGVTVHGDRTYVVGETRSTTGDANIAILARRPDGTFDTAFSDDGRHTIAIAAGAGRDAGFAVATLPDGRLRVLAATDVDATIATNLDVAVVGLMPDGSPDTSFGDGAGRVVFATGAGAGNDTPTRMALDDAGRIAITGTRVVGGKDDFFVALREADGRPAAFGDAGVRTYNRAGAQGANVSLNDRGADVAFRPGGGLVVLQQVETNPDANVNDWQAALQAFRSDGGDDPSFSGDGHLDLAAGSPDTIPGGLLAHGGRLWVTGSTKTGQDTDAFLGRMDADGSGLQFRRFDMRGTVAPGITVGSQGNDLAVVPGTPSTLIVGGFMTTESGAEWAAAAFNDIDGDLAAAGMGDVVLNTPGQGTIVGVAAHPGGWASVAGSMLDFTSADTSFGVARLLVDADKVCDLALEVLAPLEAVFESGAPVSMRVRVTNAGSKSCAGELAVPSPYRLDGGAPPRVSPLAPGASTTLDGVRLEYAGARRRSDRVQLSLTAAGDVNPQNNARTLGVVFRYCDLRLSRVGAVGALPTEGVRGVEVTVRNVGTAPCANVRFGASGAARAVAGERYTIQPGRAASDRARIRRHGAARPGARARVTLRAIGDGDVDPANDAVVFSPRVVQVGDSAVTRAGSRGFSGVATAGRGAADKRDARVTAVRVAVQRVGRGCRWMTTRSGAFRTWARPGKGACAPRAWLSARGTKRWRLALQRSLPPGTYIVHSSARIAGGLDEARFGAADRNRVTFRVR